MKPSNGILYLNLEYSALVAAGFGSIHSCLSRSLPPGSVSMTKSWLFGMEINRKCGKQRGGSHHGEKVRWKKGQEKNKWREKVGNRSVRSFISSQYKHWGWSPPRHPDHPAALRPLIAEIPHGVFICLFPLGSPASKAKRKADHLHRNRHAHCQWRIANYNLFPMFFEDTNNFLRRQHLQKTFIFWLLLTPRSERT